MLTYHVTEFQCFCAIFKKNNKKTAELKILKMPKLCFVSGPKTIHCVRADCASRKHTFPFMKTRHVWYIKILKVHIKGWLKTVLWAVLIFMFLPPLPLGHSRVRICWSTVWWSPPQHDSQRASVCGDACGHGLLLWRCPAGHAKTRAERGAGVTPSYSNLHKFGFITYLLPDA